MSDLETNSLEEYLARFSLQGPPEGLRDRVLAASRRRSRRFMLMRVAALALAAAMVAINLWCDSDPRAMKDQLASTDPMAENGDDLLGQQITRLNRFRRLTGGVAYRRPTWTALTARGGRE